MRKWRLAKFGPAVLVALLLSQGLLLSHAALDEHHEAEHCQLCAATDRLDDGVAAADSTLPSRIDVSVFSPQELSSPSSRWDSAATARGPPLS